MLHELHACALIGAFVAVGCASVRPVDARTVRGRVQPLSSLPSTGNQRDSSVAVSPESPVGQRTVLLRILSGIQHDFGTTLTPRQLAIRLDAPARSSESLGAWVFQPAGSLFEIDANAMSMDSPIDWLRVSIRAELAIHLGDLMRLFSHEYSLTRRDADYVAVEFRASHRMNVSADLRNYRPAYISSTPVVAVQLRRPGYEPSVARLVPQDR